MQILLLTETCFCNKTLLLKFHQGNESVEIKGLVLIKGKKSLLTLEVENI